MVRFLFPTECQVFGGADDPCGHVFVQVDERTCRRATGDDLAAIEMSHPGLVGGLPRYLAGDLSAPRRGEGDR